MSDIAEIYVLDKKVRLLQQTEGFRTSLDSVMLAAACPVAREGQQVLDMGCGVGSAAFCLLERVPECFVTGVDIQAECIDLAIKNAELNKKINHTSFICVPVQEFEVETPDRRFNHVICNPPYLEAGHHIVSPQKGIATARSHASDDITLEDWVKAALRLLKSGGSFTVIHRADSMDRIIQALGRSFGAIDIFPLWPAKNKPAKRVIIRAIKDRKSPTTLHQGIILHDENGKYTKEAEDILRGNNEIK